MADTALKLGDFAVPNFSKVSAVFGADIEEYPPAASIPAEFDSWHEPHAEIVNTIFFRGGSLAEHGLTFRPGIDKKAAMYAIQAWMASFAPKHEHKVATVAWAFSEWCEPLPTTAKTGA